MINGFSVRGIDNAWIVSWVETGSQGEDEPHERTIITLLDLNQLVEELMRKLRTV